MSGFAINRTSEYLTASGSAAHHFVVRRSAFALGNEHGGAFVRRKLAGAASVSG
jgi:hypothetical protein